MTFFISRFQEKFGPEVPERFGNLSNDFLSDIGSEIGTDIVRAAAAQTLGLEAESHVGEKSGKDQSSVGNEAGKELSQTTLQKAEQISMGKVSAIVKEKKEITAEEEHDITEPVEESPEPKEKEAVEQEKENIDPNTLESVESAEKLEVAEISDRELSTISLSGGKNTEEINDGNEPSDEMSSADELSRAVYTTTQN